MFWPSSSKRLNSVLKGAFDMTVALSLVWYSTTYWDSCIDGVVCFRLLALSYVSSALSIATMLSLQAFAAFFLAIKTGHMSWSHVVLTTDSIVFSPWTFQFFFGHHPLGMSFREYFA